MARDIDEMDFLELEKGASWWRGLPGIASVSRHNMLKRISGTIGPHAAEALKANPTELKSVHRLMRNVPKGGTTGKVDLSVVAPGFHKNLLKGRDLEGEALNRILTASKRSPVVRPAEPEGIAGQLGQAARKNPLATLIAGGGLGLAAKKLFSKDKGGSSGGSGSRNIVLT